MVLDFSDIKDVVSDWIDRNLDHRMILHRDDPARPMLEKLGEPMYLVDTNPTAENIARLIYEHAKEAGLPVVEVVLWETEQPAEVVTTLAPRRLVVKAGRLSIEHERSCKDLWRTGA